MSIVKKNMLKGNVEAAMGDLAYSSVRELLKQLETAKDAGERWMPQHTGLKMVSSVIDGSTAWVSEEGEAAFKARGMAAILE
jgi:hypothetical protein